MNEFLKVFTAYIVEVGPAVAFGFLISGIIHELLPERVIQRHLGGKGLKPIAYVTFIGALLPVCCWGSLPIAISFRKKGVQLGPVLAFLVATPATSVSALLVTYKLLGGFFTVYLFLSVILMGMVIGALGNLFPNKGQPLAPPMAGLGTVPVSCSHCETDKNGKIKGIFKFAFIDMPKEIGLEILLGIALAALVSTFVPIGNLVKMHLSGGGGYLFSLVFGLAMYICATASVPLVDALIHQGLNIGAGFVLLVVGPITSYGTILVLKKEFGLRILLFYLTSISAIALLLGYIFSLLKS